MTKTSFENGILTMSRLYDHPREAVFAAWTEASQTQEWWGCAQTVQVKSEIEPHVGGKYEHAMTIDGVGVHPIKGVLTVFEPPQRLSYKMPGMSENEFMMVDVTFTAKGKATEVRLTQTAIPADYGDVITTGWTASFERLGRFFDGERRAA
ncbi:MAG: SRPBCC domain-containing protein [Pseudomonadota bacterium]